MFNRKISTVTHLYPQCTPHYTRNSLNNPSPLARTSDLCLGGSPSYFVLLIPITSSNSSSLRKYCHQLTKKIGWRGEVTSSLSASTPRGRCFCCNSLIVKYSFSKVSNA